MQESRFTPAGPNAATRRAPSPATPDRPIAAPARVRVRYPEAFPDGFRLMSLPPPDFEHKLCPPEALAERVAALPRPLVFTNGCFDILHRGHVTCLARARALGAALVVALNTDASVRRLGKGDDRPINPLADRLAVIAALGCVDLVTWFDDDTPRATLLTCHPDVLVKGGDWPVEAIVGAAEVTAWGGRVQAIPFEHERSTTRLLDTIRHGQKPPE